MTAKAADEELAAALASIPNLPLDDVPDGVDEHGNVQRHVFGQARHYGFAPKPHDDLGGALGFMDFETAAKLSGARFVVLKKGLARLERAIGQFMLDLHTGEHGYTEVNPPLLVREQTAILARATEFETKFGRRACFVARRGTMAHPHRRNAADKSGPRIHRR